MCSRRTVESLESRRLLSASLLDTVQAQAAGLTLSPMVTNSTVVGHTPAQIKKAYGIDAISFGGIKGDGSGQTIAIVGAYNAPNILNDLKTFDKAFSLVDPPTFKKVSQSGSTTSLPATDAGWALELSLDVEWAHAVAPKANILLVEAKSASLGDLLSAVDYARSASGVSVVSMSWGADEFWGETSYDYHFTTPAGHQGVTFVAASGDDGSWYGAEWPSVSSNVLAVGGTSLTLGNSSGTYGSERGWSGSGGGESWYEREPSYQTSAQLTGWRTTPDVAYNADPNSGFAVYDSTAYQGYNGWEIIGGTSAGAPQWAGMIAIANQGRTLAGKTTLSNTQAIASLYTMRTTGFHDVTSGRSSYWVSAFGGYDLVTGLGTPRADLIVQGLKNAGSASTTSAAKTTTVVAVATVKAAAVTVGQNVLSATIRPVETSSPALGIDHDVILTVLDLDGGSAMGEHRLWSGAGIGVGDADHGSQLILDQHLNLGARGRQNVAAQAATPLGVGLVESRDHVVEETGWSSHYRSSDAPAERHHESIEYGQANFAVVPFDLSDQELHRDRKTILIALAAGAAIVLTQMNRFRRRRAKDLALSPLPPGED